MKLFGLLALAASVTACGTHRTAAGAPRGDGDFTANECAIAGTVSDEATGHPVPRAVVRLRALQSGAPLDPGPEKSGRLHQARTDSSGRYALRRLQPGSYTVFAERMDFTYTERRDVTVSLVGIAAIGSRSRGCEAATVDFTLRRHLPF